jgi:hypothetical protein
MAYRLSDGTILTDEQIDELADRAERGDLPGKAGKLLVAPPGRPRMSDEDLVTIAFKVPRSRRDELDRAAAAKCESRSEFLRHALDAALG